MTGLRFQNGKPAQMAIGKYQTRNNRPVDIESFRDVQVEEPGGVKVTKRLWRGKLMQMDGVTLESEYEWSNLGEFKEGTPAGYDLTTVISQVLPEPESAPPAVLENQLLCTALVDRIAAAADVKGQKPLDALNRIIAQRDEARQPAASKPPKIKLPSGKILSAHYIDQDILNVLGPYIQGAPYPASADWNFLIARYDDARYASLNPARKALFDQYVGAVLDNDTQKQADLVNAALASDQPYIDYEIDMVLGGNGPENASPGTLMAQRRFAWFYTSGPAYAPDAPPPTIPPSGPIVFTLVPPAPYEA